MKFICSGTDLSSAINKVSKAITVKKVTPILESVKISAYGDEIKICATDLELAIIKIIKGEILVEGEILLPKKGNSEFASNLPDIDIVVSTDNNQIIYNYFESECRLFCQEAREYPPIDNIKADKTFSLNSKELKKAINSVIYAVSIEDSRPVYRGCNIIIEENIATFVALDGYRMSVIKEIPVQANCDMNIIVPARTLNEISKTIDNLDENIELVISDNKIMLNLGHIVIIGRLINGDFTNYKNIIPSEVFTKVTCNVKQLKEVIDRVNFISRNEKFNSIRFDINNDSMSLTAKSDTVGNIEEKLTIEKEGKDNSIQFNAKYLIDCINNSNAEYITINIKNNVNACTIIPTDKLNHISLILPIRPTF